MAVNLYDRETCERGGPQPLNRSRPEIDGCLCYVYIIECMGLLKVGWSVQPAVRVMDLQVGNPFPLRLVDAFPAPGRSAGRIEKRVHLLLKASRVRGEWFQTDENAVRAAVVAAFGKFGIPMLTIAEVGDRLAREYVKVNDRQPLARKLIARDRVRNLIQFRFGDGTVC